jgi:hypothetical protein
MLLVGFGKMLGSRVDVVGVLNSAFGLMRTRKPVGATTGKHRAATSSTKKIGKLPAPRTAHED